MTTRSVVVKIGTTSVTDRTGGVAYEVLVNIAADVVALRDEGWNVVVVTSGAITAGWAEVGKGRARPTDSVRLQAVSAVGQPLLMESPVVTTTRLSFFSSQACFTQGSPESRPPFSRVSASRKDSGWFIFI